MSYPPNSQPYPGYPAPSGMPMPSAGMPLPGGMPTPSGMPMPGGGLPAPGAGMPGAGMPAVVPEGLPYAPQPYVQSGGGYPSQQYPSAGGSGYPSAGGSGYPSAGGSGYPPAGGSGYPPAGGSGYPSSGYPPSGSAYPPAQAPAPYPQGGSPYPASGAAPSPYPLPVTQPSGGAASYPSSGSSPYPGAAHRSSQPSAPPSRPAAPASGSAPRRPTSSTPSSSYKPTSDPNLSDYYECVKKPGDQACVKPLGSMFNPEKDATAIRGVMKSSCVNETVLVNILPYRSNVQRQKIRQFYKTMYGKDMLEDFREKLTSDFESCAAGLIMSPMEYDAYLLNKAISGAGTDEDPIIEVLCTRSNHQMSLLNQYFYDTYKRKLEDDLKGDTSGNFGRLVLSLANGARQEDRGVDQRKAEEDAKRLYKAGAGRLGTDESTFNSVFVSQSFEQLKAVFTLYQQLYKKDMEKVVKSEMSGDLERGMKAIVRFSLNKHEYFATLLYKAMKGLGTDEKVLIRVMVARSEIDLVNIRDAFTKISGGKTLEHWIKKETSGPFRDVLLHLIKTKK